MKMLRVFDGAREVSLKFNKDKCNINSTEVKFLSHIVNGKGVTPDQNKIKAIVDMPSPKSVKDLYKFLGMINYLRIYIHNLTDETTFLRSQLKNIILWT